MSPSRWSPEEQHLLGDLLTGHRDLAEPEIARALQANPELELEYRALATVAEDLDTAGRDQRDDVAEAAEGGPRTADLALAREFLGVREPAGSPHPGRWRWQWLAAAALLVAVLAATFFWGRETGRAGDDVILGAHLQSMTPRAEGDPFDEFSWQPINPLEPMGYYHVEVFDEAGTRIVNEEVTQTKLVPNAASLEALNRTRSIRWRLTCYGTAGVQYSVEARVSRQ